MQLVQKFLFIVIVNDGKPVKLYGVSFHLSEACYLVKKITLKTYAARQICWNQ